MAKTQYISGKSHELAHKALAKAVDDGRLSLGVDISKLNRPGSPVFNFLENLIFPAGGLSVLVMFTIGYGGGGAVFGGFVLLIALMLRTFWLRKVLPYRIGNRVLAEPDFFVQLWQHEGLSLLLNDGSDRKCKSPDGDWLLFLHEHFPDSRSRRYARYP